jgi:mono/diheme cytochrome c family protein
MSVSRVCTVKPERNALHAMSLRVAMVILAVGFSFGTWCARGQDQPARAQKAPDAAAMFAGPDKVDSAAAERGQNIFAPTCGFCHGADAAGKSAPDLIRSQLVLHDEEGGLIGPVVHNGRPHHGMPAFPALTNQQIADIAAFLRLRKQELSIASAMSFRDW